MKRCLCRKNSPHSKLQTHISNIYIWVANRPFKPSLSKSQILILPLTINSNFLLPIVFSSHVETIPSPSLIALIRTSANSICTTFKLYHPSLCYPIPRLPFCPRHHNFSLNYFSRLQIDLLASSATISLLFHLQFI